LKAIRLLAAMATLAAACSAHAVSNTTPPTNWRLGASDFGGAFGGVALLRFTSGSSGYVCSGSLLAGGTHVLTAAHCADDFTTMKVNFLGDMGTTYGVSHTYLHQGWTGSLSGGADIAVLKLDKQVTNLSGFELSTTNDVGKTFLMTGFGTTTTGDLGKPNWNDYPNAHWALNSFDVTSKVMEDAIWGDGDNTYGEVYVADFDNGLPAQNSLQYLANLTGNKWTSSLGVGFHEGLIAGGDSGGGDFVWVNGKWQLSGVHSWGWGLCRVCDVVPGTNSSFGDLMGSTAVYSHVGWINSVMAVPEPETYALLLAGLAVVGGIARRRRLQA